MCEPLFVLRRNHFGTKAELLQNGVEDGVKKSAQDSDECSSQGLHVSCSDVRRSTPLVASEADIHDGGTLLRCFDSTDLEPLTPSPAD